MPQLGASSHRDDGLGPGRLSHPREDAGRPGRYTDRRETTPWQNVGKLANAKLVRPFKLSMLDWLRRHVLAWDVVTSILIPSDLPMARNLCGLPTQGAEHIAPGTKQWNPPKRMLTCLFAKLPMPIEVGEKLRIVMQLRIHRFLPGCVCSMKLYNTKCPATSAQPLRHYLSGFGMWLYPCGGTCRKT